MTSRGPSLLVWAGGGLVAVATALAFLLWGLNGPAYLVDLIAAYCL